MDPYTQWHQGDESGGLECGKLQQIASPYSMLLTARMHYIKYPPQKMRKIYKKLMWLFGHMLGLMRGTPLINQA